jgi:hypothetical protein
LCLAFPKKAYYSEELTPVILSESKDPGAALGTMLHQGVLPVLPNEAAYAAVSSRRRVRWANRRIFLSA